MEHYMFEHRIQYANCICEPLLRSHVLNGLSSNTNVGTSLREDVSQLRRILDNTAEGKGSILIIISRADGFTTSLSGFRSFFERYAKLDIRLLVRDFGSQLSKRDLLLPTSVILGAMEDLPRPVQTVESSAHELVKDMMMIAQGKAL